MTWALGNDDAHSNGDGTSADRLTIDSAPADDDEHVGYAGLPGDPLFGLPAWDWHTAYFARRRPPCPGPGGSTAANVSQPEHHTAVQMHMP